MGTEAVTALEKLSTRERAIVAGVVSGKTISDSLRAAGAHPKSNTYRNRLKPGGTMNQAVCELMDDLGLDPVTLLKGMKQLSRAKKVTHFAYKGQVGDSRVDEALDIQLDAHRELLKLRRLYPKPDEDERATQAGPPALIINLNLGESAPAADPGVTIEIPSTPPACHEDTSDASRASADAPDR